MPFFLNISFSKHPDGVGKEKTGEQRKRACLGDRLQGRWGGGEIEIDGPKQKGTELRNIDFSNNSCQQRVTKYIYKTEV